MGVPTRFTCYDHAVAPRGLHSRRWSLVVVASALLVLSACGLGEGTTPRVAVGGLPSATTVPKTPANTAPAPAAAGQIPGAGQTQVPVYFVRNGQLGVARRTLAADVNIGRNALAALITGPTPMEAAAGLSTAVPSLTRVREMRLGPDNVVDLDLTGSFSALGPQGSAELRVAQIVYTLTIFPVSVRFFIEGKPAAAIGGYILPGHPLGREDVAAWAPRILLESIGPGQVLRPGSDISGSTQHAGTEVGVQLKDAAGKVLFSSSAQATEGPESRHVFQTAAQFKVDHAGPGTLTLSELTPAPGTTPLVLAVPVELG
jgi:hypothetical protein